MNRIFLNDRGITRRELMRAGLATGAAGLAGALPLPRVFGGVRDATAATPDDRRILVVFEMSGGNDGLNTVVPYGDDAYYRARPAIGIPADEVLAIDDHFGFNPGVVGFERLYKDGKMAIVHGCGYDNPSFSHFTSMAYWHTRGAEQRRGLRLGRPHRGCDDARRRREFLGEHRRHPIARGAEPRSCPGGVR